MAHIDRAHVKPEMLRWARESIGLELEVAAKKIRVKPERLRDCEGGKQLLTVKQLREAARVYRRPLAAFFLPEPPEDFRIPHDYRRLPGEPAVGLSPELIAAVREAEYRKRLASELAEDTSSRVSALIGSLSLEMNPERVAGRIRAVLGVSLAEQKSWKDHYDTLNKWKNAIEGIGVLVFHFSRVDIKEARAFSVSEPPFAVISVNGGDSPYGRVFSLFHELCHLLLGRGGTCDFRERGPVGAEERRVEVFCNYVAGAALVPESDLMNLARVREANARTEWESQQLEELGRLYHVSPQVILRRLLIVGKTNRAFFRDKQEEYEQLASERESRTGPLPLALRVVRAVGQPFLRIVLGAYQRSDITACDLSEYIGARLKHVPDIEARLARANILTGGDR